MSAEEGQKELNMRFVNPQIYRTDELRHPMELEFLKLMIAQKPQAKPQQVRQRQSGTLDSVLTNAIYRVYGFYIGLTSPRRR